MLNSEQSRPSVGTIPRPQPSRFYPHVKRAIDVGVALILAVPVAILVALAGLAILIANGRPVFFIQDRVGLNGRIFRMIKLRTMVPNGSVMHATLKGDARITPLGNFLRRSHIDELPQLWNILTGDMSLIGPRPEQPHLVDYYSERIPGYDGRHRVRPGLSGWAQVCFGYASDLEETREKLRYDLQYVTNVSPSMDFWIVLKTIQVYANPHFVR